MNHVSSVESILFVASKPLSFRAIADAVGISEADVQKIILELKIKFNHDQSGIHVLTQGDDVAFATHPSNANVIEGFTKQEAAGELTKAQLETLTVIAYRGPVTRPELEQIRGVNCALILRNLLVRGLIEERENEMGILSAFVLSFEALRHLGIHDVRELPGYESLHEHEHIEQAARAKNE